jgi:hypothetical protein
MKPNKLYPLQFWLSSIVTVPLVCLAIAFYKRTLDRTEGIFTIIGLLILYSLPSLLVIFLCFRLMVSRGVHSLVVRIVSVILYIVIFFVPGFLVSNFSLQDYLISDKHLIIYFSSGFAIASLFFRVYKRA